MILAEVKTEERNMSLEEEPIDAEEFVKEWEQMVTEIGADNMSALIKAALHKAHEAKYLSRCKSMEEAEAHFIGCSKCLRNMMPLEIYWELSHEMPDMNCELPLHTADRFQKN
jgi:hypothetical protein